MCLYTQEDATLPLLSSKSTLYLSKRFLQALSLSLLRLPSWLRAKRAGWELTIPPKRLHLCLPQQFVDLWLPKRAAHIQCHGHQADQTIGHALESLKSRLCATERAQKCAHGCA